MLAASLLMINVGGGTAAASASSVRGMWHFDEKSGTVAHDSSGRGNDGRIYGATLGKPGYLGTSFAFNTANSRVEVPSAVSLNPGTNNFAFSAFVNFTVAPGVGQTYDIVRKGLGTTKGGEYKLEITGGGRARCIAKDAAGLVGRIVGPRVSLADGAWHHVGCRFVGSTWSVIVDGEVRSRTVAFGSISNTYALSIGSKYGTQDGTPGRIDEVRLSIG